MKDKICPICHQMFTPKSSRQKYCNRKIIATCINCGKQFETVCGNNMKSTCSAKCKAQHNAISCRNHEKTCMKCGHKFIPNSSRQIYCNRPITQICEICGAEYQWHCGYEERHTCFNKACEIKYAHLKSVQSYSNETRVCKWCGKKFTPVNNTQIYCSSKHYQICKQCGKEFEIDLKKQSQEIPNFCSRECVNKYYSGDRCAFSKPEVRKKIEETNLKKYGVKYPAQSGTIQKKMWATYENKTGYSHPSHNPDVRSKTAKSRKTSKFEARVAAILDNYGIDYIWHYVISNNKASHEFDFYIPKYKILIDCDGLFYHCYNQDPNGKQAIDYYDEDRLSLISQDFIFHVIVEGQEEHDIKELENILQKIDNNIFNYDSWLFKWCRSIDFPYAEYSNSRMISDYTSLCNYNDLNSYNPACRFGDSIIENFHHSIYSAHVGNYKSPYEAWYNDKLLKKVIANRLIYKNDVNPHKIMRGFNISKIAPCVSKFNPVLAKYICFNYLSEYDEVFDPFSGFSGRLLGCISANKHYIGQDLNSIAVNESRNIIDFLSFQRLAQVSCLDALSSSGNYECLLTCPPYGKKEIYNNETEFKSCDEWVDICLNKFQCNKYVFVVDKTDKYLDNIAEEINHTSHFNKTKEFILVF